MAEEKYNRFIEELINKTKNNKLYWHYLDTDTDIYTKMGWCKEGNIGILSMSKTITPTFNRENSFYATENGFRIVLLVFGNDPADLYVIPSTYKRVLWLSASIYGELITRLLNLVQSQFPDSEEYVDMVLKKSAPQE